jgi:hypothetical protein
MLRKFSFRHVCLLRSKIPNLETLQCQVVPPLKEFDFDVPNLRLMMDRDDATWHAVLAAMDGDNQEGRFLPRLTSVKLVGDGYHVQFGSPVVQVARCFLRRVASQLVHLTALLPILADPVVPGIATTPTASIGTHASTINTASTSQPSSSSSSVSSSAQQSLAAMPNLTEINVAFSDDYLGQRYSFEHLESLLSSVAASLSSLPRLRVLGAVAVQSRIGVFPTKVLNTKPCFQLSKFPDLEYVHFALVNPFTERHVDEDDNPIDSIAPQIRQTLEYARLHPSLSQVCFYSADEHADAYLDAASATRDAVETLRRENCGEIDAARLTRLLLHSKFQTSEDGIGLPMLTAAVMSNKPELLEWFLSQPDFSPAQVLQLTFGSNLAVDVSWFDESMRALMRHITKDMVNSFATAVLCSVVKKQAMSYAASLCRRIDSFYFDEVERQGWFSLFPDMLRTALCMLINVEPTNREDELTDEEFLQRVGSSHLFSFTPFFNRLFLG